MRYYRAFIQGYVKIKELMFDLTKKDLVFQRTPRCHVTFETLKQKLLEAPILTKLDFLKTFILDVDWSIKVGTQNHEHRALSLESKIRIEIMDEM
jgi:hypothetical protein